VFMFGKDLKFTKVLDEIQILVFFFFFPFVFFNTLIIKGF
jgi:hypothetical protein